MNRWKPEPGNHPHMRVLDLPSKAPTFYYHRKLDIDTTLANFKMECPLCPEFKLYHLSAIVNTGKDSCRSLNVLVELTEEQFALFSYSFRIHIRTKMTNYVFKEADKSSRATIVGYNNFVTLVVNTLNSGSRNPRHINPELYFMSGVDDSSEMIRLLRANGWEEWKDPRKGKPSRRKYVYWHKPGFCFKVRPHAFIMAVRERDGFWTIPQLSLFMRKHGLKSFRDYFDNHPLIEDDQPHMM
jgi:hypothetical protein